MSAPVIAICYKRPMEDTARCLGCQRRFVYDVDDQEFECGVISYLPGWCEDCGDLLGALDFFPGEEVAD